MLSQTCNTRVFASYYHYSWYSGVTAGQAAIVKFAVWNLSIALMHVIA